MKFFARMKSPDPALAETPKVDRRSLVVGAGVAGAAAVGAAVLHRQAVEVPASAAVAPAAGEEGYRLTPHVLQYYETTRT
jgi:hypothetical protein